MARILSLLALSAAVGVLAARGGTRASHKAPGAERRSSSRAAVRAAAKQRPSAPGSGITKFTPESIDNSVTTQFNRPSLLPYNATANAAAVVTSGSARFTVLTPQLIRME
jgi:hypothetical protein